jgi:hypothetical protein
MVKKKYLEILTGLHLFALRGYESVVFGVPRVCLLVCMVAYVLPFIRLYKLHSHSAFECLSVLHRCPMNLNIPAPKIGTLQICIKTQNRYFL